MWQHYYWQNIFMWNMTTYKCKLKNSRCERETYLSRIENHIFVLKSWTNSKKEFRVGTKNTVGRVSGNTQLMLRLNSLLNKAMHRSAKFQTPPNAVDLL